MTGKSTIDKMLRDTRNRIHIYWKANDEEHHKALYPKSISGNRVDWRQFSIDMAYDLYNTMWTEVCHYFNVLVPDDLPYRVQVCWDTIHIPSLPEDRQERLDLEKTDIYKTYIELFVDSECRACTDSMFSDAYKTLLKACKHNGDEDMDDSIIDDDYKSLRWLCYLFYDSNMLHYQNGRVDVGAWVLRDGSYICIDSASHRRFVEEFLGKKEFDMERYWVKVSLYHVHTHDKMSNEQWDTICKFTKKYALSETKLDVRPINGWFRGGNLCQE